jgi:hypothetical protein
MFNLIFLTSTPGPVGAIKPNAWRSSASDSCGSSFPAASSGVC